MYQLLATVYELESHYHVNALLYDGEQQTFKVPIASAHLSYVREPGASADHGDIIGWVVQVCHELAGNIDEVLF